MFSETTTSKGLNRQGTYDRPKTNNIHLYENSRGGPSKDINICLKATRMPNGKTPADLVNAFNMYRELTCVLETRVSGINLCSIKKKLLNAVEGEIRPTTSEIQALATEGLQQSLDVIENTRRLSESISQEITNMFNVLALDELERAADHISQLVETFQKIVSNPSTIFPRLACGDIPIDPAKISNFRKRYMQLKRLEGGDPGLKQQERSASGPPKTSLDVVTNIKSSLDSLSNDILASIAGVKEFTGQIGKLCGTAESLRSSAEQTALVAEKQEDIQQLVSRVSSMFTTADENVAERSLNSAKILSPLRAAREAFAVVEKMETSNEELVDTIEKLRELDNELSSFISTSKKLVSGVVGKVASVIDKFNLLKDYLLNYIRELHQFFMPSGFKAFLLKPSDALMSITESVAVLRKRLSEQEIKSRSVIKILSEGNSTQIVMDIKTQVAVLLCLPTNLINTVRSQDLSRVISDTLERVISELCGEVGSSVLGGIAGATLDAIGQGDFESKFNKPLTSITESQSDEEEQPRRAKTASLLDNVVSFPWSVMKIFGCFAPSYIFMRRI